MPATWRRARTLLEEAVSADPENAQARMMLGLVNMQQGNLGQAEMHLANVVARDPDNVRAQQLLASVRSRLQSPEQTLESLKPALERPTVDPSLFALAGQLSLQSGNREEALGYLAQAAQSSSPSTPEAQLELASGYLAAGELERAVEILEAMPSTERALRGCSARPCSWRPCCGRARRVKPSCGPTRWPRARRTMATSHSVAGSDLRCGRAA